MKFFVIFFLWVGVLYSHQTLTKHTTGEKVSLQLAWKYQFKVAGFIAAKEKGFYQDVGLDVELKEYQPGVDIIEDVLSQKSTFGVYNSNVFKNYLVDEKPIRLIASYFKRSALVLITKPHIRSLKELSGATIMGMNKENFAFDFRPFLDKYQISLENLHFIPEAYKVEDFKLKEIDAMTAFISDQPHTLDKLGIKYNILNPSDLTSYHLQSELFTSDAQVQNDPRRIENFKEASRKGWEYALSHKEEIAKLIHKKYAKNISIEALMYEAQEIEKLILPQTYLIGSIDENFLYKQRQHFINHYNLKYEKSLQNFIFKSKIIHLTKLEKEYLKKNRVIPICIYPKIFPIDGYHDGQHSGIMGDIFKIFSQQLQVEFKPIFSKNHEELHKNIQQKRCKAISIFPVDSSKKDELILGKPFFSTYFTLISKLDKTFVRTNNELKDKIFVVQCEEYKKIILQRYPMLNIVVENDIQQMVESVLKGDTYAIIEINEVSDLLIDKYGYGKLKINGFLFKENRMNGAIATAKSEPILAKLIQKSFYTISQHKLDLIIKSWDITRYHQDVNYELIFKIVIPMVFFLLILIYYQRKLKKSNKELALKIQELHKKDKILTIQSKQAIMGEMISMIAHQWRQPLSTITLQISNLQLKEMLNEKVTQEETNKVLAQISESVIYLSETIDDFKTFFHPDKASSRIKLSDLFVKVNTLLLPRLSATNIDYILEYDKDFFLKTYVNELIQVLLNMLSNAIDAFDGVDVENKTIKLSAKLSFKSIFFYVEDNGSGIDDKNIEKLFEPYFSTKDKNGTGLGLYMSQMIIEKQFGGKIFVEPLKNGTQFIVELPRDVNE